MRLSTDDNTASTIVETRSPISSKIETRASKGYVRDTQVIAEGQTPQQPYDYKLFLEMIRCDPVLSTAVDTTVDVVTRNGYYFMPRKGELTKVRQKKLREQFDHELNFDEVVDNLIYQFIIHHVSYMELVGKKGNVKELNPLESTEMFIDYDVHGTIKGYFQNPSQANKVSFRKDQVVLFRFKQIGSQVYPYSNFEPIAKTYATSIKANEYLQQIFLNMPPKLMYILKNASEAQRKSFIANLRVMKTNYNSDLVTNARDGAEVKPLIFPEIFQGIMKVLEYVREQVLMVMRVPPVWIGIVNDQGANRSNSEAQIYSFETRIRKIQQKFESQINRELLPALGITDVWFKFNNVSLQDETKHVQNAAVLHSIGLDGESVLFYLRNKGIDIPLGAKIEDEVESKANQTAINKTAGSRQSMDKKNDSQVSQVGKTGVSEEGKKKTEEKNMQVRSSISYKAKGYPYEYEVRK